MIKLLIMAVLLLFINTYAQDETDLKEGAKAPNFTLKDGYGREYTLSDYNEKSNVVIYFYPEAGTSGCTKQACGIRDDIRKFHENNIKVFGVSTDSPKEIKKFIADYNLNFPLLSDQNKIVSKKYGVLSDNNTAKRVTFIIDKKGKIAKVIKVKNVLSHSSEVLKIASRLN